MYTSVEYCLACNSHSTKHLKCLPFYCCHAMAALEQFTLLCAARTGSGLVLVCHESCGLSIQKGRAMQDLWREQAHVPPPTKKPLTSAPTPQRKTATLECAYYGHSWQCIGMSGEKQCTVCGITGYCPGCTSTPPKGAQPFSCTKHTLPSSPSQHRSEVLP